MNSNPIIEAWSKGEKSWEAGPLSVYPITMFLGILISFLSAAYHWRRQKYSWEVMQIILIIIVPTSILGARFWYAVSNPESFKSFFVFEGLSIHGGVIISTFSVIGYLLIFQRGTIDIRTAVGIIVPNILIGQVIGRWGNFANHEVYGGVVSGNSLNWLDWIGIKSHMFIEGEYRAPFFLYELMLNSLGYITLSLVLLRRNTLKPGVTGALYFVWYGIVRVIMEPLRDESDIMMIGNLEVSTLVSILYIVVGGFIAIWWQFLLKNTYKWVEKPKRILNKIIAAVFVVFPTWLIMWNTGKEETYKTLKDELWNREFFNRMYEKKTWTRSMKKWVFFGDVTDKEITYYERIDSRYLKMQKDSKTEKALSPKVNVK